MSAAQNPTGALNNRRAVKKIITLVAICKKGAESRTAQTASPKILVVKPMIQAIIGGLEKYPKAGSFDHAQYCASSPCNPQGARNRMRRRMSNRLKSKTIKRLGSPPKVLERP